MVVNSRAVDLLDEHELRTVLGHEAGHILSDHVLYRTALMILLQLGGATRLPLIAGPAAAGRPARAARVVPRRRADAATARPRSSTATRWSRCRTLMVMAGGVRSRKLNLDAFLKQANEYEEWEPGWDKLSRLRTRARADAHAYPVRRVSRADEVGPLRRVRPDRRRRVPARGDRPTPATRPATPPSYYAERFRGFFKDAGAGVDKAGDKVGDAADKLSGWLRDRDRRQPRSVRGGRGDRR